MLANFNNLKIYFIGIGGIGMSSLALYLKSKNFIVLGSDKSISKQTKILTKNGIIVYNEKNLQAVESSDIIVYTSAISDSDLELNLAKKLQKPTYTRSQLLNLIISSFDKSIGVSGSHGKTSITAMIASILDCAKKSFTAFIGGFTSKYSNFYTDQKKQLVVSEVCEFKKAIYDIKVDYAICCNIDNDHLDSYKSIENIKDAFYSYLDRSKVKIVCNDDEYLKGYKGENVYTYGIKNKSFAMAKNVTELIGKYSFDLVIDNKNYGRINLNVFGEYSVYNALSAILTCYLLNVPINDIKKGIASYNGVERRFEYLGKLYKKNIILDYAHHPTEIKNAIITAKQVFKDNLFIIFEPHTYSRTKLLFYDFINVFDGENVSFYKTFSAREDYIFDGSSEKLAITLNKKYLETYEEVLNAIKSTNCNNVFIIGAGELYDKLKLQTKKD